ncbi:MAG: hypothetical protein KH020_21295 [Clostridiales bacterium]|nr:hypothetical protein [Clostridiales bacterium]
MNGEEIVTTETHPFYVNDRGFVNAGELAVGDELLDSNKNILLVENFDVELTGKPVTVYNFQECRVFSRENEKNKSKSISWSRIRKKST